MKSTYKEQVKGWSRIYPPLRISLLLIYITSQIMSGDAGQLAQKAGESLTNYQHALGFIIMESYD